MWIVSVFTRTRIAMLLMLPNLQTCVDFGHGVMHYEFTFRGVDNITTVLKNMMLLNVNKVNGNSENKFIYFCFTSEVASIQKLKNLTLKFQKQEDLAFMLQK